MQFGIHINSYKKLLNYLGIKSIYKILDVTQQIAEIDEVILKKFKVGDRYIYVNEYNSSGVKIEKRDREEFYKDIRGVIWKKPKDGYYFDLYHSPLKEAKLKDLEKYDW